MGDLDAKARLHMKDFEESEELLQACLQGGEVDPADALALEMPGRYEEARRAFERVTTLVAASKAEFKKVQIHFSALNTKSDEFWLLWDEALLPKDVILHPQKVS